MRKRYAVDFDPSTPVIELCRYSIVTATAIESANRIEELERCIRRTLEENAHLADGDNCTLIGLKNVLPLED